MDHTSILVDESWRPLAGTSFCLRIDIPDLGWRAHRWFDDPQLKAAGRLYHGKGVRRDPDQCNENRQRAAQLMKELAEQENPAAQYGLGLWLRPGYGLDDLTGTMGSAASWFLRAAAQGYVHSLVHLGRCVATGAGVPADPRAAYELFVQGAKYLDHVAEYELGNCFESGVGVDVDFEQAAHWFMKAHLLEEARHELSAMGYEPVPGASYFDTTWVRGSANSVGRELKREPDRPARD